MKKLLLHSCCGPCSTAVIEKLLPDYDITVYYYNPNTEPFEEYEKRRIEQIKVCDYYNVPLIFGEYENEKFLEAAKGLEDVPEGGSRCLRCFDLRLRNTAELARKLGFDCFDTTLSVSPYKDSAALIKTGSVISEEVGIEFVAGNYKKNDGYKRSCELSEMLGLYRQNFCGCNYGNWTLK